MEQTLTTRRAWLLAARPKTLILSLNPVVLAASLALKEHSFYFSSFFLTLVFSFLTQIGTNWANDYFDYVKGADTKTRKGPARAVQNKLISPEKMKKGFILIFILASIVAMPLVFQGGIAILLLLVFSISLGILYTGGPFPLAYLGLGEIFAIVFFGPAACLGAYYLQTLSFSLLPIIAGMGPGLLSAAVLVVNNLRDRHEDKKVGKNTLSVRFGKFFTQMEYLLFLSIAFAIPIYFKIRGWSSLWTLSILVLFPQMLFCIYSIFFQEKENDLLVKTARFSLPYTLCFCLGILS